MARCSSGSPFRHRWWCAWILCVAIGGCGWLDNPREKAAQHIAKGDFATARIEAATAIERNDGDGEAYLLLGHALFGQGQFKIADETLKRARELGADRNRVDDLRARLLTRLSDYDRILAELDPDPGLRGQALARVLAARALAQAAKGAPDEARRSLQAALDVVPELPEARLVHAQLAWSEKRPEEAAMLADSIIARSPEFAAAHELKAKLLVARGEIDAAIEAFGQAASRDPTNIESSLAAAELSIARKQFDAARKHIDAARKYAHGNSFLVRHVQALLHFEQAQYDQTLSLSHSVLKAKPDFVPAMVLAGAAHLVRGELNQAETQFRAVARAQPEHHLVNKLYAKTLLRKGRPKDALGLLNPALEKARDDPTLLTLAAEAHMQMKEFGTATAYYEKAARSSADPAAALMRLGLARITGGQANEGIATLEQAAGSSSDDASAHTKLALLHLQRGEPRKALDAARTIQSKAPQNPIGFNLAGVASLRLDDRAAARAAFERANRIDPGYWPAAAHLASLDLVAGNRDAAKARIEKALAADANNIRSMATLLQITGDRRRYIESLETARQADPKAIAPRVVLARAYLAQGLPERALPIAREVAAAAPGRPPAMELLGTVQLAAGRHNEALTTFRDLVTSAPKSPRAHVRLGQVLVAHKDLRGAESAFRKALVLRPHDTEAVTALARLYGRENRLEDALKLAGELQRNHPKSAAGFALSGDIYFGAKRYAEAAKAYDAAFSRSPAGGLLVQRHVAQSRAGDNPGDAALVQWLENRPNDLAVRMHLADLRYVQGEFREAAEHYETIVKFDPNLAAVWNNLASAYLKLGDRRALPSAEAAHGLNPDDAAILDTLGVAQTRYGKADHAVETLKKAAARRPDSAGIRVNYALALAKTGERAAARAEIRKAVDSGKPVTLDKEAKALLQAR